MPANKNAVIRYQKLDELLSDRHHHYTMVEITDKVNDYLVDLGYEEVTRRCLEKDINFMEERPFVLQSKGLHLTASDVSNMEEAIFPYLQRS